MSGDRERFYEERDRRTTAYGVGAGRLDHPVRIVVAEGTASSSAGQASVLALVNMVARVHRRVQLEVPAAPLEVASLVAADDLLAACVETARTIDPLIDLDVQEGGWSSGDIPSVGLGSATHSTCDLYVGADGWSASVDAEPSNFTTHPATLMGGYLAAVLAAASLMQLTFDRQPEVRRLSLWGFAEGDVADPGPRGEPGALDVGDVLVVGAGAVASGFFYWCRELGLSGDWEVADGDRVRLHNTNRAMTFTASDAGWAEGVERGVGRMKVDAVAPGLPVRRFPGWYANWLHARGDRRPDLVLPLANDFDVRAAIGQRGENIIVHATTSPTWTAQLHRHVAGRDDCIDCRLPSGRTIRFECAEAPLPVIPDAHDGESSDAALPFLSAGAGLLLLAALYQLQAGVLVAMRHNFWRLMLDLGPRRTIRGGVHTCREGCSKVLGTDVRERLNAGTRWGDV